MEFKVLKVDDARWIGASFPDGRLALIDYKADALVVNVRLPGDCQDCFDVSADGRLLVTGYLLGPTNALDVWDLRSMTRIATSKVAPLSVAFGPDPRWLIVYPATGRTFAWNYEDDVKQPLKWAEAPSNGIRNVERQEYLLPTGRRRQVLAARFAPFRAAVRQLPVQGRIWRMERSPAADSMVVLDSASCVYCLSYPEHRLLWRESVPDVEWVCFCGNGRFIAVAIREAQRFEIRVLDARRGDVLRTIPYNDRCEYPLVGSQALSRSGECVDLSTGKVTSGVSRTGWWRSRLGTVRMTAR